MLLQATLPGVDAATAHAHVAAATAAATPDVPPELLLAIAFVESRYDATATSRVVAGKRRTGPYRSTEPPAHLDPHASLFCGPLQTFARTWSECLAQRDLAVGYAAAVSELTHWLGDRRAHHSIVRALAGHGCGNAGVVTGRCNGYPERVRAIERRLEQPLAPRILAEL